MVEQRTENSCVAGSSPAYGTKQMESNAAGLVLRPALKTGFSEMGWGSTPLLSANNIDRFYIRLYN
jgi:hypothetical protein